MMLRTIDSRLPFGGRLEPGRSHRSGIAHPEGSTADPAQEPRSRQAARTEPHDHQRHTVATAVRGAVPRCPAKIRELEHHLPSIPAMERGRGLGDRRGDVGRDHDGHRPLQHRHHHRSRPRLGSGRKRGAHRRALGRSRGGFTSKPHCLADALGRPLAFHLTGGEAADCKAYDALIVLPLRTPDALLADKG